MTWPRATVLVRVLSFIVGGISLGVAWWLTKIGRSGVEDVPPPFILVSGFVGIALLCLAVTGRYPRPGA